MRRTESRRRYSAKRWTFAFLLACLPATALVAHDTAGTALCGMTVVENLKLEHDLTCVGLGLIVGADGITIKLNGHSITGSGSGVGIDVAGRTEVSISGGTVRNFATGVRVLSSTDIVVKENTFRGNTADSCPF